VVVAVSAVRVAAESEVKGVLLVTVAQAAAESEVKGVLLVTVAQAAARLLRFSSLYGGGWTILAMPTHRDRASRSMSSRRTRTRPGNS